MEKLISELTRLYLPAGTTVPGALAQQIAGQATSAFRLADSVGLVRAIVLPFDREGDSENDQHWTRLCTVANALQQELGLPAPAVSITGAIGYRLWLSLESPLPVAQAQEFARLLRLAYAPDAGPASDTVGEPVELPPCLNIGTGKWAAFIHPGMGASFAGEAGLDMPPPLSSQAGFLESLHSISPPQFAHALELLRQTHGGEPTMVAPVSQPNSYVDGLLLKDATLEDIVRHLHSKNIEPTFRHLLPQPQR